jgi:sucrose-6F-phosphate phosphohydrolase
MDRTVIPNGAQPEHPHARQRFRTFCQQADVVLAYVTGRHKSLVEQAITDYALPEPDYAITDVGSKIYQINNGKWSELMDWQQEIAPCWKGKSHIEIATYLKDIPDLIMQESHKQNSHKLSYYISLCVDKDIIIDNITQLLEKEGIEASTIWSIDEPENIGLLDILPSNATKLHAIAFLQHKLHYRHQETIFAGDSGNDMPVLVSAVQSVLVDNASDEVKEMALEQVVKNGHRASLYLAKVEYCDMNANYAAGVLEGVGHFSPEFQDCIRASK